MKSLIGLFLCMAFIPLRAIADVDKVYDPYVYRGELEVEARGVHQFDDENKHKLKFGVGYGVNDLWFVEGYAIVEQETGGHAEVSDLELENKFQLTEKGRYWADLGALVELEKELGEDKWEVKAGPLLQKQVRRWLVTANLFLEKQFGSDRSDSDVEFLGAAQLKYRLSPALEPAVEYYADEETHSLGPVLTGTWHRGRTPIRWEAGVLAGLTGKSADVSFRWLVEFEFY
jgi:hypothetical protein